MILEQSIPCKHRIGKIQEEIFTCDIHGLCSIDRIHPRLHPCIACTDRSKSRITNLDGTQCIHRREEIGQQKCPTCVGTVSVKIFLCLIHKSCQLGNKLADTHSCLDCLNFQKKP